MKKISHLFIIMKKDPPVEMIDTTLFYGHCLILLFIRTITRKDFPAEICLVSVIHSIRTLPPGFFLNCLKLIP